MSTGEAVATETRANARVRMLRENCIVELKSGGGRKKYGGPRTGTRERCRYIDGQERRVDKKMEFTNTSEGYDRR